MSLNIACSVSRSHSTARTQQFVYYFPRKKRKGDERDDDKRHHVKHKRLKRHININIAACVPHIFPKTVGVRSTEERRQLRNVNGRSYL